MLLNKYKNHKLYHNYITTVPLPGFDFIVYYAEMMTQNTVVFEHRHNLYEIFYGLEGSILFSCEGSQSELTAHDMVLLGRDRSHYLQYQSNTPAVYFTIPLFSYTNQNGACRKADPVLAWREKASPTGKAVTEGD